MIRTLIGTFSLTLLFAAQANAASLTIGGTDSATVGQQFTLEITGDFMDEGLIAGGITLLWDSTLVELVDITLNLAVTPDFSCPGSSNCPAPGPGTAAVVWGEFLNDLIDIGSPPVVMATVTFAALDLGTAVFEMIDNTDLTGGWFGAGFAPIDAPQLGSTSVQVVPLPAAVWFMIGGLGTLLGFRRRN